MVVGLGVAVKVRWEMVRCWIYLDSRVCRISHCGVVRVRERKKVKDDFKVLGLSSWKARVAISWDKSVGWGGFGEKSMIYIFLRAWYFIIWMQHYQLTWIFSFKDVPNAMSTAEITDKLGLQSVRRRNWHIQATSATSGDGFYEGLDWLSSQLKNQKWLEAIHSCASWRNQLPVCVCKEQVWMCGWAWGGFLTRCLGSAIRKPVLQFKKKQHYVLYTTSCFSSLDDHLYSWRRNPEGCRVHRSQGDLHGGKEKGCWQEDQVQLWSPGPGVSAYPGPC